MCNEYKIQLYEFPWKYVTIPRDDILVHAYVYTEFISWFVKLGP